MATRLFPGAHIGSIYGLIYAFNAFGAGLGAVLAGLMHDLTGSYRPSFVFAVCCLLIAAQPFLHVAQLRDFRVRRAAGAS